MARKKLTIEERIAKYQEMIDKLTDGAGIGPGKSVGIQRHKDWIPKHELRKMVTAYKIVGRIGESLEGRSYRQRNRHAAEALKDLSAYAFQTARDIREEAMKPFAIEGYSKYGGLPDIIPGPRISAKLLKQRREENEEAARIEAERAFGGKKRTRKKR